MTDARIVRTRAALHSSITDLAAHKPVPTITVSELAVRAGINRVTFYKHYASPAEALIAALGSELDTAREHFVSDASDSAVSTVATTIRLVLDHVDRHRALYQLAINTPEDGVVPNLLADHFTGSLQQYLAEHPELTPPNPEVDVTIAVRFFAHGLVGAIKAWIQEGSTDRTAFIATVLSYSPEWMFPTDD
ncbi:hypothetical protein G7068_06105 [Leucobacter viscericola]|uniref:HTH tetR-type domain-containing protein n=1 Tax=Leucobacter viscericola TaxID=2714935 RepID=A0A6G7XEE3_9MICO|nr:TetR/AcrR family transcriptional regulator [Leucobacter viscericola]QIK62819.1 hypothetical protein G7068_06105 [Leucobacter viscericola]